MVEEQVKLEGHCTPIGPKTWIEFTPCGDIVCSKTGGGCLFHKDFSGNKELEILLNSAFSLAQNAAKRRYPEHTEGIKWLGTYHPIIWSCLVQFGEPKDLILLASENPAPSLDNGKLAYFRDASKLELGVRTAVAAGRYIKRHWPDARDNEIAEMVRIHFPAALQLKFLATVPEIIKAVVHGPTSCMKWELDEDDYDQHPYNCYSPELGWNLAVLVEGSEVRSRALVQVADKVFVRTFSDADSDRATACPELAAQLVALGYTKRISWVGYQIKKIESATSYDCLFPYIDGNCRTVFDNGDGTWVISEDPNKVQFLCENTDGTADEVGLYECTCCGYTTTDPDNMRNTEDGYVCDSCFEDYTWACVGYDCEYTREGVYYYNEVYYTEAGLAHHDLVILHDGGIERRDSVFEIDGEYFRASEVGDCDHSGDLCKRDDLVQIKLGSKILLVQEEYVEQYENEGWSQ